MAAVSSHGYFSVSGRQTSGYGQDVYSVLAILQRNFFQCFQTVGGKSRAYNIDILDTLSPPFFQLLVGVRLKPSFAAKT